MSFLKLRKLFSSEPANSGGLGWRKVRLCYFLHMHKKEHFSQKGFVWLLQLR